MPHWLVLAGGLPTGGYVNLGESPSLPWGQLLDRLSCKQPASNVPWSWQNVCLSPEGGPGQFPTAYTCMCGHPYTHIYTYYSYTIHICMHMHTYAHTCISTYTYTHIHAYTYAARLLRITVPRPHPTASLICYLNTKFSKKEVGTVSKFKPSGNSKFKPGYFTLYSVPKSDFRIFKNSIFPTFTFSPLPHSLTRKLL